MDSLDQIVASYKLEQTMNNIDSDSVRPKGAVPGNPAAVPGAAHNKTAALKARLARILSASAVRTAEMADGPTHFTLGVERIDEALRGHAGPSGLPRATLHELHAASREDATSAAAMALLLAHRASDGKPMLWIRESGDMRRQGRLYPPGLAELGIDPGAIIHVDAPDNIAVLRAAADGVRNAAMGAVIAELAGRRPRGLDLTATRRLSLSSRESGVPCLLLRSGSDADDPLPSAAFSRWAVAAAPSSPIPVRGAHDPIAAQAPGHSAFDITLLRHRSGLYGLSARLEWNRDDRSFRERSAGGEAAAHAGAVPALPAGRADHPGTRAA